MTHHWRILRLSMGDHNFELFTSAGHLSCPVWQMFSDYTPEDPEEDLNRYHIADQRVTRAFLEQQGLLFEKLDVDKQRGRAQGVLTRLLDCGWQMLEQVADPMTGSLDVTMRLPPSLPSRVSDPSETFMVRWKGVDLEAVHRRADVDVYFLEEVFCGPELHESTAWRRKLLHRYGLSEAIASDDAQESASLRFLIGYKWPPSRSALIEARLISALLQGGWEPFEYQVDGIRWHLAFHPPGSLVGGDSETADLWSKLASHRIAKARLSGVG